MLRQVETNVEDPVVVDNTSMMEVERRLSIQLFYVRALTCRGKTLQVVRRVPEGFGFEAWKQLCREFETRLPSRFQGMVQALLSPTKNGRSGADNLSMGEQGEGLRGTVT